MTQDIILKYLSWVMLFALASLSIAFMPYFNNLYYIILMSIAILLCFQRNIIWNTRILFLVIACVLSLVLNDPLPIFKCWQRLALFILVLLVASPLFSNELISSFRIRLFSGVMWLVVFIAIASCIAYFMGIDLSLRNKDAEIIYFGGVTRTSMLLAPSSGIALVFLLTLLLSKHYPQKYKIYWLIGLIIGLLASFIMLLVSGSRGAFLATVVSLLFVFYKCNRRHLSKFILSIMLLSGGMYFSYSLWSPFLEVLERKQSGNDGRGSATSSRDSKWQARYDEFNSSPMFGIGFSAVDVKNSSDYTSEGVVETGTSWGGMLSMIGLCGFVPFLILFIESFWSLYKDDQQIYISGLVGALMFWFAVHMLVEGYVLAGGSFLCIILWLTIGVADAHRLKILELQESEVNDEEKV